MELISVTIAVLIMFLLIVILLVTLMAIWLIRHSGRP